MNERGSSHDGDTESDTTDKTKGRIPRTSPGMIRGVERIIRRYTNDKERIRKLTVGVKDIVRYSNKRNS